ncbi:MAG: hydrogenase expression/synthesis HypA [Actinomycetia bacterium]|nr:hydrogenase expression/synthesis HypA [Actinomycetes bacterium]
MHELSICGAIADIVSRRAGGRPVRVINVRVGQLRQVVPDTLAYCWELLSADTSLDGSRLAIERVPARLRCRGCGSEAEIGDLPVFICASCGGTDTQVVAGEELLITSLDLAPEAGAEGVSN